MKVFQSQHLGGFLLASKEKLSITNRYFLHFLSIVSKCLTGVNKTKPEL